MRDENKPKKQLISELTELRQRVVESEKAGIQHRRTKGEVGENEHYFQSLFFHMPQDILVITPDYRIVDVNKAFLITTGRKREEVIGRHCYEISHGYNEPCEQHGEKCVLREVFRTGKTGTCRHQHISADGSMIWVEILISPLRDDEGNITHAIQSLRDVTDLVDSKEALQETETRYRAIVEDQEELICRFLPGGILTFVNEAYCRYFDKKREDLISNSFISLIPVSDQQKINAHLDSLGPANPVSTHEHRVIGQNGEIRWQQWTNRAILDEKGLIKEFQSVGRDITDRKLAEEALRKAHDELERRIQERTYELQEAIKELRKEIKNRKRVEEALRESESRMKSILKAAPIGIGLVYNRVFVWNSDRMNAMLGYSEDELIGKSARVAYESNEEFERVGRDKYLEIQKRGVGTVETRFKRKDGSIIDVLLCSSPTDPPDLSKGVIFTALDITERKRAEEALEESVENFRALAENANDAILIATGGKGINVYANKRAAEVTGYSVAELLEIGLAELVAPDEVEKVAERYTRRLKGEIVPGQYETTLVKKSGEMFPVELSSARTVWEGESAAIALIRDITGRKQAEEKLRRRETDLELRTNELEEVNSALRVLLKRREDDKSDLEEKVLSNVKELVLPYVERLKKSALGAKQGTYLSILESNLEDIVSPFVRKLSSTYLGLTPTEINVANLVKEAWDTKTIAESLNMSPRTVESHRQNIRKKLGLKNKKANLRTHLLAMQ